MNARSRLLRAAVLVFAGLLVWLGVGFAAAQRACAHDPRFACSPRAPQNPVRIPDAGKSWAFYGRLAAGESDTYAFTIPAPQTVPVQLLVERQDAGNPARPQAQILREGSGTPTTVSFSGAAPFFEPFSRVWYLETPERPLALLPGVYTATVRMRGGSAPQRYVFAIGQAERFGIGEIPFVIGAVYRVHTRGY